MASKSFTEDDCNVYAAWGGERRPLGERGLPISNFTYRDATLPRRSVGKSYAKARLRANRHPYGLKWVPACGTDSYAHSCTASDLRIAGLDRQLMVNSYSRDSFRDLNNQRFYELLGNVQPYAVMDRYDLEQILTNQVREKRLCAKNPRIYSGKNLPLFLHSGVDTQRLYDLPAAGYQYEQGSSKELMGFGAQNLAHNQQVQPLSIPYGVGQSTRISDPTKKFCRSDFAPNLPSL